MEVKRPRPRRHVEKSKWCIEGEVEIGGRRELIEMIVLEGMRFIAAHSRAQAVKLFADRFIRYFGTKKVYIGNAEVYRVGTLAIDQIPARLVKLSIPKEVPGKVTQLSFGF